MQQQLNNIDKAIAYLSKTDKKTHNLVAIHPNTNEIKGITDNLENLKPFISAHIDHYNLYFTVNEPHAKATNSKLSKNDIASLWGVWLDADPVKGADFQSERKRLYEFAKELKLSSTPPSVITDSGAGIQAFWYLREPLPATPDNALLYEAIGRGLAEKYSIDAVQNIDRIMRLPFTTNFPNENKRKAGRAITESKLLFANNITYSNDIICNLVKPIYATESVSDVDYDFDFEPLETLPVRLQTIWDNLQITDEKIKGILSAQLPSRSEYDMALISRLKDLGWAIEDVAQVLYIFPLGKNNAITKREIARAYARAASSVTIMSLPDDIVNSMMAQKNPTIMEPPTRKYKPAGKLSWRSTATPLFKGLMNSGTLVSIYGASNVGKSFVATDIAAHLALGRSWGGYKCKQRGSVLYVAAEAAATYGVRADAVKKRIGVALDASITDFPFGVYDAHINLFHVDKTVGKCLGLEQLVAEAGFLHSDTGLPCRLIVIDTLAAVFGGGNENSFEDMGLIVDHLLQLAKRTGATVIIVHHSGKDAVKGERGHSSLYAALDTSLEVKVENVGGREKRVMSARKQRDGSRDVSVEFNLKLVELGTDDEGDVVTSCQILLETDPEFSSVIPHKLSQLTLNQLAMWNAVAWAGLIGDSKQSMINGYYKFFLDNPDKNTIDTISNHIRRVSSLRLDTLPISSASFGRGKSNLYDTVQRLSSLGYIVKNDNNQWVTYELSSGVQ